MEISGIISGELKDDLHAAQFVTWLNALNADAWTEMKQAFPKRGVALVSEAPGPSDALELTSKAGLIGLLPSEAPQPGDIRLMSGCTAQMRGRLVELQVTLSSKDALTKLLEALGRVGFASLECRLVSEVASESFVWRARV